MKDKKIFTVFLIIFVICIIGFFTGVISYIIGTEWGGRLIIGSFIGGVVSFLLTSFGANIDI